MFNLTVRLSDADKTALTAAAVDSNHTVHDLVVISISLIKAIIDERRSGHKLIVTTADGTPVKELVIP